MCNHVKLEIHLLVMNFNRGAGGVRVRVVGGGGGSLRVLYFVVDTVYGLGRSLGD